MPETIAATNRDHRPAPRRPLPAAVLWDMDGTLVDTEPYWLAAEADIVTEHGATWSYEQGLELIGRALVESAAVLREVAGVPGTNEEIAADIVERVVRRVTDEPPAWQPGARETLQALVAAGVPCALVTASYRTLADPIIAMLPPGTFQAVVTGEEVSRGKPDPQPYLLAADRLGVDITRCVAVEDSPPGVAAAQASGAATIAVPFLIDIPAHPRRRVLPTLEGLTVADLAAVLAELNDPARPVPEEDQ